MGEGPGKTRQHDQKKKSGHRPIYASNRFAVFMATEIARAYSCQPKERY